MSDKPQLNRDSTMAVTAKAGKEFLGNEKLGDTRQNTQAKKAAKKATLRKGQTIKKTIEEAKQLLGNSANLTDVDSARQLRKRTAPPPKPPAPKRVHKKGAGRPPKKAKANNNTASATNASNAATTQPAADGAATVA